MHKELRKRFFVALALLLVLAAFLNVLPAHARDSDPIWRVEISLLTGDIKRAGTDDRVRVRLSEHNLTNVDYGRDDFERGDGFKYDLNLEELATIEDIDRIEISKKGSNGWCVEKLELHINNIHVYTHDFAPPCLWLDNSNDHTRSFSISGDTLRNDADWGDYRHPRRKDILERGLPRHEMVSRIESAIGHSIASTDFYWGDLHGPAVEINRKSGDRLEVDLDLSLEKSWSWDQEVDVNFDISVRCEADNLVLAIENWDADRDFHHWYSVVLMPNTQLFSPLPSDALIAMFADDFGSSFSTCPAVAVEVNGDISFIDTNAGNVAIVSGDYAAKSCSYAPALDLIVVPHRGDRTEHGVFSDGWISLVNHDGSVNTLQWLTSDEKTGAFINDPLATEIVDGILYVIDHSGGAGDDYPLVAVVTMWDVATGDPRGMHSVPDSAGFHDLAVTSSGTIYAIETGDPGRVFRINADGNWSVFIDGAAGILRHPSDIAIDNDGNIVLVSRSGSNALTFGTDGELLSRRYSADGGTTGIVIMADGTKYVSSDRFGNVSMLPPGGIGEPIAVGLPGIASMCYDAGADQLVVPMYNRHALGFIKMGKY